MSGRYYNKEKTESIYSERHLLDSLSPSSEDTIPLIPLHTALNNIFPPTINTNIK